MGVEMDNKKMSGGFETFLALALRTIGGFSIVCKWLADLDTVSGAAALDEWRLFNHF